MKKVCLILLTVLLLSLTAFALAETKPGEEVTVDLTLTNTEACYVRVKAEYDVDVFELVSYDSEVGIPGPEGIVLVDAKPLASGVIGSVTLKVKDGAEPGEYAVGGWPDECYDLEGNDCETTVTGGTVTVAAAARPEYAVNGLAYNWPLTTGTVEHVENTPELETVYARVAYFCEGGACMVNIEPIDPENKSFRSGAMGTIVYISVMVLDVDNAYPASIAIPHTYGMGVLPLDID